MTDKNIYSRMQQKHDVQANWEKAVNFTPLVGEIIIYDPDENNLKSRIKIGDGKTNVNNLIFIGNEEALLYSEQTLTEEQKAQARENISAVSDADIYTIVENAIDTEIISLTLTGDSGVYVEHTGLCKSRLLDIYLYAPIAITENMKILRVRNALINTYVSPIVYANTPTLTVDKFYDNVQYNGEHDATIDCDIEINHNYKYMFINTNANANGNIKDGASYSIISKKQLPNTDINVHLAEHYDIVLGDTLELFYAGIIDVANIENYFIEVTSSIGNAYKKRWMFTPSDNHVDKSYELTLTVKDDSGNVRGSAGTTIRVVKSAMQTEQVALSGNAGAYAQPNRLTKAQTAGFYFYDPISINGDMTTLRLENVIVNPYVAKIAYSNSPTISVGEWLPSVVVLEGSDGDIVSVDIEIDTNYQYMYISTNCSSGGTIKDTNDAYHIIYGEEKKGNVLCVGDSLTQGGEWVKEFANRLAADGFYEINLIGSREVGGVKFEGYGGWTYVSYNTANKSNGYVWITCDHNKTDADQHSVYLIGSTKWKIETIETGRLKMIRTSGSENMPSSGTLTWVSDGSNHDDVVFTASEIAAGNPFWNESTSQVDFANYMSNIGLTGQTIDYCILLLGWNETGRTETDFKANVNTFCTNLRNAYPNCKIMLIGLQIPSLDGMGANYGTTWKLSEKSNFVHNLDKWYQDITDSLENTKAVQLCGQFDTEHNMPTGTRQVNRRNPTTETYGTNGVHPNGYGYLQIADAVYRGFVGF